ncbi:MAG: hypothetical protein HKN40_08340 [Winogradskyella sp.]|uniref:cytidylyltransferase domain-containing protein n=1 Tax=Winogradskyella sp. TaxID=1883156 RepID=UPI0017943625|nr:hypothetical protein [Winogradskyella sp.]
MVVGHYKIGAIIQARLGSYRLPNKVLMPMPVGSKESILSRIIKSLGKTAMIDKIYVATSVNQLNDPIEEICKSLTIHCFRGSEDNVLSRFYNIIKNEDFDFVLRFTADNPIIDQNYLEVFIINHLKKQLDYSSSKGLPLGCNFEMFKSETIIAAQKHTSDIYDKEHVTPYIKRHYNNLETYIFEMEEKVSNFRFTIDYASDYAFINLMYSMLNRENKYSVHDFISLIKENQWLKDINSINIQKVKVETLYEEINLILPIAKQLELGRLTNLLENEREKNTNI